MQKHIFFCNKIWAKCKPIPLFPTNLIFSIESVCDACDVMHFILKPIAGYTLFFVAYLEHTDKSCEVLRIYEYKKSMQRA